MVNAETLAALIRESPGHNRCDLTRLLANAEAFSAVISSLVEPFRSERVDLVAALDATGFALGGAAAAMLGAGLALIRKPGKAAWPTNRQEFVDYKGEPDSFHLVADAILPGQRVLLVDDWAETGGQALAAIQLLERAGGVIVGATFINIDRRVRDDRRFWSYRLHSVLNYGKT